jgi:hypothetical protein
MFDYILEFVQNNRLNWFAEKNPVHVYNEAAECYIPEPLVGDVKAFVLSEFAESFELYFLNCYVLKGKMLYYEESFEKLNKTIRENNNPQFAKAFLDLQTTSEKRKNIYFTTIKPYIQSL